jgi:hypothetical protein
MVQGLFFIIFFKKNPKTIDNNTMVCYNGIKSKIAVGVTAKVPRRFHDGSREEGQQEGSADDD